MAGTNKNNQRQQQQAQQKEFANGVNVKTIHTKFGEIIKLGVNLEAFSENPINERGYINLELKKSKAGEYYVVLSE